MKIWNAVETADRGYIEALQLERLQQTVARVYERVPFYRKRLDEAGIKPQDIRSLKDLQRIPFTLKEDLRQNYPYGLFAAPMNEIVRIHASTGTTGKPTVVGYTRRDLDNWSELIARIVTMAGGGAGDIAQIAFGYGLFTGALGLHYGLEKVGAAVIPISSGNTKKQIMMMQDLGTTLLIATPSYALYIAEVAESMGIDPARDLKLRVGLFGGEGSTVAMRSQLDRRLGILATENYGLSEVMGPGVSGECVAREGMHINEDHFICEIIDPVTGEVLEPGKRGEMVITTITKEGIPLLRYRTRDITCIIPEKCACGRTSYRMEKVRGRSDDMLIIRGVNVFPSQIEEILLGMDDVGGNYEIVVSRDGYLDRMEVRVELANGQYLETFTRLEGLARTIKSRLKTVLGIDAKVTLCEPNTLQRFEGKAKRVIDQRNLIEK